MAEKHVYVFGEIGYENNVQSVAASLQGATTEDKIIVHIHSPGGDVNEGFAILDHLLSYGAVIETRIEGLCASIATIISMAGSKRTITENSTFFIHNPWTVTEGDSEALQQMADQLKAVEERIAQFYAKYTKRDKEEMLILMKQADNITPERALELGFVTEIAQPVMAMARFTPLITMSETKLNSIMSIFLNEIRSLFNLNSKNEIKNLDTTLEDGTPITIEGEEVAVGAAVTVNGEPAPDGGHTLADGTGIVTVGGVITDVMQPGEDNGEEVEISIEDLQAQITEKDATIAALNTEIETLKASVSEHQNVLAEIKDKFEQKQPIFNRTPRTPATKSADKKGNRFTASEISAKLDSTKRKK
jgi:ATP-dependent protease ClpP protease subunit/uncharacterized coiled-coil protein SlyX